MERLSLGRLCYNFIFTNRTRILTVRVIVLSAWYRLRIKLVPMAKLEGSFGERGCQSPDEEPPEVMRTARLIGKRVERVCKKTTWDSKCLVRALVARRILLGKGIHTTLYLGLRKEDDTLHAHAWLRCGNYIVTGGEGAEGHTVVSFFYK